MHHALLFEATRGGTELENLQLPGNRLNACQAATVSELAQKVKLERAFLFRTSSLINLAPDIIEAILNGKEPAKLTLSKLRKGFPENWDEQRKMFGM